MPKPNFFIVGAPKCGTTSMYEYLRQHPDIFMPMHKEPHYFGSDLESRRFSRFRGNEKKYLALFDGAKQQKRIGEASVWYLYSRRAAGEIHAFDPQAKIIVMLRSPVEMLHSLFYDHLFAGYENINTFEKALAAEPDRKMGQQLPKDLYIMRDVLYYREIVSYADQVRRYFDVFGRDQVSVIIFDDLKLNVAQVYRDTLSFLEVDPDFNADLRPHNASRQISSRGILKLLRNRWLISLGDKMPRIATPIYIWIREGITKRAPRMPMAPETRDQLTRELRPGIEQLGDLLGRDLSAWVQTGRSTEQAI